jgi:hypothetical protein
MALSAAKLPFAAPANLALGLVMIGGFAVSFAMMVAAARIGNTDLGVALLIGFAPALLLGIPGLIGLASAVLVAIGFIGYLKLARIPNPSEHPQTAQQITEVSFYLGALATWSYV